MKLARRVVGKISHLFFQFTSRLFPVRGRVLMLHNVGAEAGEFNVSLEEFQELLRFLEKRNVVRLENWEWQSDFYALTIDDVPESFYLNAFPLLKQYCIPFTIFVNTSLLDTPGFLSTAELLEIAQCGLCTVGSHGVHHGEFTLLNKAQALADLKDSKQSLETLLQRPIELFAFPYGSYYACGYANKHLAGDVYKYAFGTVACPVTYPRLLKRYFLPRINVDSNLIKNL